MKINLIDTSHFYKNLEGVDEKPGDTPEPGRFRTVFGKALKGHKGWVLPIEVLQKAASNLGGASLRIWSTPKQEIPTQR